MIKKPSKEDRQPTKAKNRFLFIGIVVLLFSTGIYFYSLQRESNQLSQSPDNFLFKTVQNQELHISVSPNHIKIEEFNGKIIFLKVFGWNCKYCQKEIPELVQLKKKFITAFNTIAIEEQQHTHQENLEFIKKHHINYGIVEGNHQERFLSYLKKEYQWNGVIPLTIVIDAKGEILAFEVGYKSYNLTTLLHTTLEKITQTALPQK